MHAHSVTYVHTLSTLMRVQKVHVHAGKCYDTLQVIYLIVLLEHLIGIQPWSQSIMVLEHSYLSWNTTSLNFLILPSLHKHALVHTWMNWKRITSPFSVGKAAREVWSEAHRDCYRRFPGAWHCPAMEIRCRHCNIFRRWVTSYKHKLGKHVENSDNSQHTVAAKFKNFDGYLSAKHHVHIICTCMCTEVIPMSDL